jgi:hypothetical protein
MNVDGSVPPSRKICGQALACSAEHPVRDQYLMPTVAYHSRGGL